MTERERQEREKARGYGATDAQMEDFLRRNTNPNGTQDVHRLGEAFEPTFSGGGRGGDADQNRDGVADAGWVPNAPGKGRAWMRASEGPPMRAMSPYGMASSAMTLRPAPPMNPYAMRARGPQTLGELMGLVDWRYTGGN